MSPEQAPPPRINIRFVYAYCHAIEPIRRFYSEALGMQEASCIDNEQMGWIVYQSEGFQLMFFRHTDAPTWRQDSYWGWSIKDPMGQTVEVYSSPAQRPAGDPPVWPA